MNVTGQRVAQGAYLVDALLVHAYHLL